MSKKVYLTEAQLSAVIAPMLCEGLFGNCKNFQELRQSMIKAVRNGLISAAMLITVIGTYNMLTNAQKDELKEEIAEAAPIEQWTCIADDVIATVYNAVKGQCNGDYSHTASGFKLDLSDVGAHKVIAMERTFMAEFNLKYGDVVKVEGTYLGKQDGIYVIEDTMNKRFGDPNSKDYYPHKIDILVPNNIKYGGTAKGATCKVYKLNNKKDSSDFRAEMKPSLNNIESKRTDD